MSPYYIFLTLFAMAIYFIATDESIAVAFYYATKLVKFYYERQKWWLLNNPRNPIVKYLMWKRSNQLANELMKEFESRNK